MNKHLEILQNKKEELEKQIQQEKELAKQKTTGETLYWYEFSQNNSGGVMHEDESICNRLFIQAHSYNEARQKALSIGVYFDGCDNGIDCSCCGDRWSDYERKITFPHRYSFELSFNNIEEYAQQLANDYGTWTSPDGRLFYYEGTVKPVYKTEKQA